MTESQFLYHYCSTQTAFSILKFRTIRLSPLSAANDSLEGRVLGRVFSQLLQATGLPKGVVDVASFMVEGYADATEGFAFCLSENGDLLSQWRAYARDGTGIAIGFAPPVLKEDFGAVNFGAQFCELLKVGYGEDDLRQTLVPFAEQIERDFAEHGEFVRMNHGKTRDEALRCFADRHADLKGLIVVRDKSSISLISRLLQILAPLHFRIYSTKPQAFQEEREWRLLRYQHRVAMQQIEYFADEYSVRPFISCLMADPARAAIGEVILGPKHRSNIDWVRAFLASVGLPHVVVKRSHIESYR